MPDSASTGKPVRMILAVADPYAAFERALRAGTQEINPVGEGNGWRIGRMADPFGNHWEIGHRLRPPARAYHPGKAGEVRGGSVSCRRRRWPPGRRRR